MHPATIFAVVELILISVLLGALAGLLRAVRVGDHGAEAVFKIVASLAFVVIGVSRWSGGNPVATWLVVGLALCAAGDTLLLFKRGFDAGLLAFLLGHLAYIVAFHHATPVTGWPRVVLIPLLLAAIGALSWLWPHLGSRKLPVAIYVAVISTMVWGAVAVVADRQLGWTVAVGATLFYLSDLTVARNRFVEASFLVRLLGLPLYYAGQVLIALTV